MPSQHVDTARDPAPDSPQRNRLRDAPPALHAFVWGLFGALTLLLLALYAVYRDTDLWAQLGYPPPGHSPFAEAIRGSVFRTRANTWSNLSYILVGLYAAAYAVWDMRRPTTAGDPYAVREPALMALFGAACFVLGLGSGLMHAALTSWGHKADVFGMYFALSALVVLQWARWVPALRIGSRRWPTWPVLALASTAGSGYLVLSPAAMAVADRVVMGLIAIVWLNATADVLFGGAKQQRHWLAIALASLAVAYYLWNLDVAGRFSAPDAWLQGHALWHVLTGVSLGCMAAFYRSEVPGGRGKITN